MSPIWKIEAKAVSSPVGSYFFSKTKLLDRVVSLESELAESKIALLRYPLLESENEKLKLFLGRVTSDTRLLGTVLVPPNRNGYDTLLIDIGESQPVSLGGIVVAHPDIPIGTIETLNSNSALVSLFSNPGRETEAIFADDSPLTLVGSGGGNFKVELPRSIQINVGDVIRLPQLSSKIVGVVGSIKSSPADAFQTVLINSPINIFSLRYVEVIVEN
ncbi:MAG: hypothetical protein ISR99_01745 [Parcubacteria group bacterium]|nr:hypothetical protein [Parcubacteria group bacterium]